MAKGRSMSEHGVHHGKPGKRPSSHASIPADWHTRDLIGFCVDSKRAIVDGPFGSNLKTIHFRDKGVPVINSSFVTGFSFKPDHYTFVDEDLFRREIRSKVEPGDIVMAKIGARCGSSAIMPQGHAVSILSGNSLKITVDCDRNSNEFVWYNLVWHYQKNQFADCRSTGAQPAISTPLLKKLRLPQPSKREQDAIAYVLSRWDICISKTQELIAAKELRKKALVQQLLTGKKRLTGFKGVWQHASINSIASELSIKNSKDKKLTVLSCTKHEGLVPSLEYFGRKVFSNDLSTYKVVPRNAFAYATNHIEEGSIGYQSRYDEALISPMYTVFKTSKSVNDEFLYSVLKTHKYVHEYQKRMEGSIDRRGGLRWDEFSKIRVPIPDFVEQTAIVKVLFATSREVVVLKQKLDLLKEQKRGLMQKLLTGQIRVNHK